MATSAFAECLVGPARRGHDAIDLELRRKTAVSQGLPEPVVEFSSYPLS